MNWYIRKEAYEICSELKELITAIESGRKVVIKKKRKVSLSVR
jgi:hypothetical protein